LSQRKRDDEQYQLTDGCALCNAWADLKASLASCAVRIARFPGYSRASRLHSMRTDIAVSAPADSDVSTTAVLTSRHASVVMLERCCVGKGDIFRRSHWRLYEFHLAQDTQDQTMRLSSYSPLYRIPRKPKHRQPQKLSRAYSLGSFTDDKIWFQSTCP